MSKSLENEVFIPQQLCQTRFSHLISMGVAFLAGLFLLLGSPGSDLSTMVVTTGLDGARADLVAALLLTSLAALVGAISRQSRAGALFGASLAFGCGYLAHFIQNALQPTYDPAGNLEQLNALALLSRSCTLAALALLAAFIGTTVGGALAQILLDPLVQLFKRGWRRKPLPAGQKRSAWQGLPLLGAWLRALALGAIFVMSIGSRDLFLYAPDVNVHTIMPAKVNRALAAHGTILTDHLVSQSTRREQTFLLYLPPSYFLEQARTKRYPVLYLLHGSPGAAQDWFVAGQANTSADALITMSRISEVILVLPDGNGLPGMTSEWADSWNRAQLIETYVSHELVSYVDQHYRTLADASHRAIGGLSMGGFGAMNMAIHHPDVFGRVLSFGGYYQAEGAIWGKNVAYQQANSPLITIRQNQQAQKLHIYLGAASEDQPYYNDTRQFAHTLDELHIPYAFDVLSGHHSWNVWQSQLYHALLWLHWT
jgi:S-formylglutathione hydrolase FrmB